MDEITQRLLIRILGLLAGLSLVEVMVLSTIVATDMTIVMAVISVPSTIVGILGGFLGGKTLTEKQSEEIEKAFEDIEKL